MTDLTQLQARIDQAQRKEAQLQVAREAAQQRMQEAATALKEEFGVSSVEEALNLAETLDAELAVDTQRIIELLEEGNA